MKDFKGILTFHCLQDVCTPSTGSMTPLNLQHPLNGHTVMTDLINPTANQLSFAQHKSILVHSIPATRMQIHICILSHFQEKLTEDRKITAQKGQQLIWVMPKHICFLSNKCLPTLPKVQQFFCATTNTTFHPAVCWLVI